MTAPKPTRCQRVLNSFYMVRKYVLDSLIYISFRFYGLEVTRRDIENGTYDSPRDFLKLNLDNADVDGVLLATQESYAESGRRMLAISDKCRSLLSVAALLLTAIGVFLPKYLVFNALWMRITFFITAVLLLNCITITLIFFSIRNHTTLSIDQAEANLPPNDLKKSLINDYRECKWSLEKKIDYLVNVYSVARFFFLFSFSLFVLLFSWNFLFVSAPADPSFERVLKKELAFIKGEPGKSGEKGDKGDTPKIDEEGLLRKLLVDKEFEKRVRAIVEAQDSPLSPPSSGAKK